MLTKEQLVELSNLVRLSAFGGFLVFAVILISLNHRAFTKFLGQRSKSFWWFILIFSIFPLLLILYIFSFLFGGFNLEKQGDLVLRIFARK